MKFRVKKISYFVTLLSYSKLVIYERPIFCASYKHFILAKYYYASVNRHKFIRVVQNKNFEYPEAFG